MSLTVKGDHVNTAGDVATCYASSRIIIQTIGRGQGSSVTHYFLPLQCRSCVDVGARRPGGNQTRVGETKPEFHVSPLFACYGCPPLFLKKRKRPDLMQWHYESNYLQTLTRIQT